MPASKTAKPPRRRRSMPGLIDLDAYLIPPDATGVPKRIRDLDAVARNAKEQAASLHADVKAAEMALERRVVRDARAEAEALAAGEDLPEPTAPGRRRDLDAVKRRALVAEKTAHSALFDLRDAIDEERAAGEWAKRQRQAVAKDLARVEKAAVELKSALLALGADVGVLRGIEEPREGFFAADVVRPRDGRAVPFESDQMIARIVQTAHENAARDPAKPSTQAAADSSKALAEAFK